jgi:hypothetical protein
MELHLGRGGSVIALLFSVIHGMPLPFRRAEYLIGPIEIAI